MTPSDSKNDLIGGRVQPLALVFLVALSLLGFLPIANWIQGAPSAPWYADVLESWVFGTVILAGALVVLLILSRQQAPIIAADLSQKIARSFDRSPLLSISIISLAAAGFYALIALAVFDGRPIFIDEIVQLYQARLLASGRVAEVVGPYPEFFSALNVVNVGERQFGQFPPGGPAHLALGVLFGVPWLITPLIGGMAVYVFGSLVRHVEAEPSVALGALLLFATSPFMIFMSASHMNHVVTLMWILVAWFASLRFLASGGSAARYMLLFGFAVGIAATIRPLDAVTMTAPAGVLCVRAALRGRNALRAFLLAAAAMLLPAAALLAFNKATTGSAFVFGYELLWGKSHSLGFHASPWGGAHTPARGLELLNLYMLRLQSYLFESPVPSLLPVIATLAFSRRSAAFDRAMLWAAALLAIGYFAYWHDGFYLGPRFFFVLLPVLVLLAARAPRAIGAWAGSERVRRLAFLSLTLTVLGGLSLGLPERARYHARSLSSARQQPVAIVDSLGIRSALIFVRESWGSQVLARLWGRGIPRSDAERLYRSVDTCVLDSAATHLEGSGVTGQEARARMWPLLGDSLAVHSSTLSPDQTERVRAGYGYPARCLERIAEDRRGFLLYPPVLAAARGSNVFVRDLGARNVILTAQYSGRNSYLLVPRDSSGSSLELRPLYADSNGR